MMNQKYFNKRNIIIVLTFLLICVGGFFLYRYFLYDYLTYDRPFRTLEGQRGRISSVLFSPDGQTIVSGSFDGTIRLWDAASGNLKQTLKANRGGVNALAISPDGQKVASCGIDRELLVFEATNGNLLFSKNYEYGILSLAFSPDGQTLAIAGDAIYFLDSANGNIRYSISTDNFYALAIAFSPDGKTLASSVRSEIKLWDTANGNLKQTLAESAESARSLIFSPDGQTLVGASLNGKIFVWEVGSGKLKNTFAPNSDNIPISISPDGKTIASGGLEGSRETERYDGEIEFWDLTNGNLIRKFAKQRSQVTSLSFSPNGKTLAAGNRDGTIGLWNVE